MANILVVGGSSGIGAAVARQAVAGGHLVRAMSRGGDVPGSLKGSCEGFSGDATDAGDVRTALSGIDVVVQALGIAISPKMVFGPVSLFSTSTRVLVPLMKELGVSRLIAVTGFGAGDSRSSINFVQRLPFKLLLGTAYDDKSVQERLIVDSDLDWLIVRPGVLTNGRRSGHYRVLQEPDEWRNGIISRADVADFIVSQVDGLSRQKPVVIRFPL